MRFDDTLKVKVLSGAGFDIDLNPVTPTETWQELGKCVIFPNNKAATNIANFQIILRFFLVTFDIFPTPY